MPNVSIGDDEFFNVAKIASGRASSTISSTISSTMSLRVAGRVVNMCAYSQDFVMMQSRIACCKFGAHTI